MAGSPIVTTAINAAFAMGMMAHSDETDDSHERAGMHPGCAIVPAALAVAEREGADGARFIQGVVAGYDIGCRMTQALGVQNVRSRALSLHGIGTNFGAAAAAASILGLKEESVRFVWDYSCQQDSGKYYWMRDRDHVEKAFVFAAMGARNGVTSALLVQSGFTGVDDAFSGENNYFESFGPGVNPETAHRRAGQPLRDPAHGHQEILRRGADPGPARRPFDPAGAARPDGRGRREHHRLAFPTTGCSSSGTGTCRTSI